MKVQTSQVSETCEVYSHPLQATGQREWLVPNADGQVVGVSVWHQTRCGYSSWYLKCLQRSFADLLFHLLNCYTID